MLSNCALAAASSTSRLVCARRTFASLAPGSNNQDHDPPALPAVLPTPVPPVRPARSSPPRNRSPHMNLETFLQQIRAIVDVVGSKSTLSLNQKRLLEFAGLVSPTSESLITRHLDVNQLSSLRNYFSTYIEAKAVKPRFKPSLRQALEAAVTTVNAAWPKSLPMSALPETSPRPSPSPPLPPAPVKVVEVGERRGRIKPIASPTRIKWDAPESISPFAASQLRERSRHDIRALNSAVLTGRHSGKALSSSIDANVDIEPVNEMRPIARLAHGLDRALFKYVLEYISLKL